MIIQHLGLTFQVHSPALWELQDRAISFVYYPNRGWFVGIEPNMLHKTPFKTRDEAILFVKGLIEVGYDPSA